MGCLDVSCTEVGASTSRRAKGAPAEGAGLAGEDGRRVGAGGHHRIAKARRDLFSGESEVGDYIGIK